MVALHSQMQVTGDVAEIQDFGGFISMRFLQNANVDGEDFHLHGDCIHVNTSHTSVPIITIAFAGSG